MGVAFRKDVTAERVRELLDYDPTSGDFTWRVHRGNGARMGAKAGYLDPDGYLRIWIDGKPYVAHRLVWLHVHGRWPESDLDHIDGNRSHNWLSNLREAEHWQNMHNRLAPRKRRDPTMPTGVQERYGKFRAMISLNGKRVVLGVFNTKEEAGEAYRAAAVKHAQEYSHVHRAAERTIDWRSRAKQLEALLTANGIAFDTLEQLPEPVVPESGGQNG